MWTPWGSITIEQLAITYDRALFALNCEPEDSATCCSSAVAPSPDLQHVSNWQQFALPLLRVTFLLQINKLTFPRVFLHPACVCLSMRVCVSCCMRPARIPVAGTLYPDSRLLLLRRRCSPLQQKQQSICAFALVFPLSHCSPLVCLVYPFCVCHNFSSFFWFPIVPFLLSFPIRGLLNHYCCLRSPFAQVNRLKTDPRSCDKWLLLN